MCKDRNIEIRVNGTLIQSLNTNDAVAADYLLFIDGVLSILLKGRDALESEAQKNGRSILVHPFAGVGSVSIPKVTDE